MLNKFASLALVIALVCTLGGTSAIARASSDPEVKPKAGEAAPESRTEIKKDTRSDTKLRADVLTLVADAKAGKIAPSAAQMQPAKSNNLSKGTKIAIGVGIAVAVVAVVLFRPGGPLRGD